jgi:hypothetical protein
MSNTFEKLTWNNTFRWVAIFFSFLIFVFIVLFEARINSIIKLLECEYYLYMKPLIIIVLIIIILIFLSKVLKWQFLRRLFYFFRPFYKNCNKEWHKTIIAISIFIIIPGIILSFFYYFQLFSSTTVFKGYNFFDQLSYVLAYIGLLLTVRVYYEVKEGHTESLEDFIKILTEILDLSDDEDEIVIYAPTLFLNEAQIIKKTATYKNTAYRSKLRDKSNLKLHILDTGNSLDTFNDNITKNELANNHDAHARKVNSFIDSNCNLNLFHKWSLKFELEEQANHVHERTDYYHGLISFMKSIPKDRIKNDYKLIEPIELTNIRKAKGSFAVANFDKGLYYFGSFEASDEAEPYFRGTSFTNKNIKRDELKNLINAITL